MLSSWFPFDLTLFSHSMPLTQIPCVTPLTVPPLSSSPLPSRPSPTSLRLYSIRTVTMVTGCCNEAHKVTRHDQATTVTNCYDPTIYIPPSWHKSITNQLLSCCNPTTTLPWCFSGLLGTLINNLNPHQGNGLLNPCYKFATTLPPLFHLPFTNLSGNCPNDFPTVFTIPSWACHDQTTNHPWTGRNPIITLPQLWYEPDTTSTTVPNIVLMVAMKSFI